MFVVKFIVSSLIFFTSIALAEDNALSEKVASSNDWLIHKGEKTPILKPLTSFTSRVMSVTAFPLFTAVDMAILTAKQAHEIPYLILNKESTQHQARYRKNAETLRKKSLGLLAAPLGLLSPDIVTHHFVPNQIQNFQLIPYGKLYSIYGQVIYPESVLDIQFIVKEAEHSGKSISVLGKFMSQGKQAISNQAWNIVINTSKLNQITIDPVLKIAKVGAGASWGDLQREANQHGLAVRVMQASNIFSIGGSISANCHGWDYKTGCLRNTLLALKIVDSKGRVLNLTPEDPLFDFIVGGYGGFGIIVEATLSLTDNLELIENGIEIAPRDYVTYFNENIRHNKDIDMHLYRLSLEPTHLFQTGVAVNYQRKSDVPVIATLKDEPVRGTRMDRIKLHAIRRLSWLRKLAWKVEKKEALAETIASRNELMRPPINVVFNNSNIDAEWLQEYFIKGEDLSDFLHFLGNILRINHVAVFNASVRFVKQDFKTKLSYAQLGDRFAVVLFFNQNLSPSEIRKTKTWVRQVIDYLIAHEGSYYLPYQHFATVEQFKACYPNWKTIISYKQYIDPNNIFFNGFYGDYLALDNYQDSLFRKVFKRVDGQRDKVRSFLNNVFMQLDKKKFFDLVDSILENPKLNDKQIYETLYNKIDRAKLNPISNIHKTFKSLNCLKKDLAEQTAFLVNPKKINGYVEIGYPGRMVHPLKKHIEIKGRVYVVNDQERFSDYIEGGFPRPYDQFIPLNDYEPISEDAIATASVDLVCMYIGLHHITKNKLDPFIASIERILKPGGTFILMDHDAGSKEMQDFVDVVHSIYNAATGVSPEIEAQEVRNFNALEYWIDRVHAHHLVYHESEPLIRKGDSTLNALIRFDKPLTSQITPAAFLNLNNDHQRPQIQTYLTAPEWQNVRAAQRYASFVENEPAYRYPYFSEVCGFWKVYAKSWQAAQKESSFSDIAFSDYNLMNLFVGTTMTLEYGFKGVLSAPFVLINKVLDINKKDATTKSPSDAERLRSLKAYGKYIENTPFYKYPYFKDIGSYWKTYLKNNDSLGNRIKGAFVGTGMTLEYAIKGLISLPLSYIYGSEAMKEAETTHLVIQDPENVVETIDPNIVILETNPEHGLKHVEIPRYMHFTEIMLKIAKKASMTCINIEGYDKIQVDVKAPLGGVHPYLGTQIIYIIPAPTDRKHTYAALEVNVNQLCEVLRKLENDHVEILFIHDY